jgi:ribosomal-protein-alanine N-acetyltransferase
MMLAHHVVAPLTIQPMRKRHLRQVLKIEEQVYPRPWSFSTYISELKQPSTRIYLVGYLHGRIEGYAGLLFQGPDGHVTTIAVDPAMQGNRIGERLLYALLTKAVAMGAKDLTLEVRMSNEAAKHLYAKFGFAPAGIRKNYYSDVNEDALIMWAHDVSEPEYLARLDRIGAGFAGSIIDAAGDASDDDDAREHAEGHENE